MINNESQKFFDDAKLILEEHYPLFKNWLKKEINLELIYRASRDGWESNIFHQKCDNKGPTIVVVRSELGKIFGGYASISWDRSGNDKKD